MRDHAREHADWKRHLASLRDDPEWLEWFAHREAGLRVFFTEVVPDMPDQPWTEVGLRHAEAAALRLLPDGDTGHQSTFRLLDPIHRYLGELFVRTLDGAWRYAVPTDGPGPRPVVEVPYSLEPLDVEMLLSAALERRTGDELSRVLQMQQDDHEDWVRGGRLPYPEWAPVKWARFWDE